jgi:hypothetical protein
LTDRIAARGFRKAPQSVGIEGRKGLDLLWQEDERIRLPVRWTGLRAQLLLEGDAASADQSEVADFFREKDSGEQAGSVCVRSDSTAGLSTSTNRYQFRGYPYLLLRRPRAGFPSWIYRRYCISILNTYYVSVPVDRKVDGQVRIAESGQRVRASLFKS